VKFGLSHSAIRDLVTRAELNGNKSPEYIPTNSSTIPKRIGEVSNRIEVVELELTKLRARARRAEIELQLNLGHWFDHKESDSALSQGQRF
jgi:hypothetical protein